MQYDSDRKESARRPWAFFLALLFHVVLLLALLVKRDAPAQPLPIQQSKPTKKTLQEP
ncbi:MAG: hypothetical protein ACK5SQ_08600 [Chitinophagales bacterium]|jgi:hypothetical protein